MEHDNDVQLPANRQAPPAEAGGKIRPVSIADIRAFNPSRRLNIEQHMRSCK